MNLYVQNRNRKVAFIFCLLLLCRCGSDSNMPQSAANEGEPFSNLQTQTSDLGSVLSLVATVSLDDPDAQNHPLRLEKLILHPDTGDYFVLEQNSNRGILHFDHLGSFQNSYGTRGTGLHEFLLINGIGLDHRNNNLYLLSAFKILVFNLKDNSQVTYPLEELLPSYSRLAVFRDIQVSENKLRIIVEDLEHDQIIRDVLEIPTSFQGSFQAITPRYVMPQEAANIRKPSITGDARDLFIAYPPHYNILHITSTGHTQLYQNPLQLKGVRLPEDQKTPEMNYFGWDGTHLWINFSFSKQSKLLPITYLNNFLNPAGRHITFLELIDFHKKPNDEQIELRNKANIIGHQGNTVYGRVLSEKHWTHIRNRNPNIKHEGAADQVPDILIMKLNQN